MPMHAEKTFFTWRAASNKKRAQKRRPAVTTVRRVWHCFKGCTEL